MCLVGKELLRFEGSGAGIRRADRAQNVGSRLRFRRMRIARTLTESRDRPDTNSGSNILGIPSGI